MTHRKRAPKKTNQPDAKSTVPIRYTAAPEAPVSEPVVTAPSRPIATEQQPQKPVAPTPPRQFMMPVESLSGAYLTGRVQQGCIAVGEQVFINGDYSKPYRLYRFGDDTAKTYASAGEQARLYLEPNRKGALKQARIITGDPTPTANAYRFSGSVEEYFTDLLRTHFAEYTLQKKVEWPGLAMPVIPTTSSCFIGPEKNWIRQ